MDPEQNEQLEGFASEITSSDYAFVIDEDGDLKSVYMPAAGMEIPPAVKKIFRMFGIKNPHDVEVHIVH
jgi:hypothetical protein